jgi:hypothetical protein
MKIQTANQVSGRAIGAIFFAGFGALWLARISHRRIVDLCESGRRK